MTNSQSRLQRELKQGRPFRNPADEALLAVRRTADVLARAVSRTLEPHGITDQQYNVLRILRGSHPDGLPTLEIADRMIERQPNVTRLLDRLERKGWVRRARSKEDRRVVRCWVTDRGLALLSALDAPIDAMDDRLARNLTRREQKQLIELLERIRETESDERGEGE